MGSVHVNNSLRVDRGFRRPAPGVTARPIRSTARYPLSWCGMPARRHENSQQDPERAMPPKKKKITGLIKLQINAGAANPAPPVGPALGPHGVNIMEFCKAYNAATESQRGQVIPVEITIYEDRTFSFITKTPPAAELIKKAAGVPKGSGVPHREKVGKISRDQVRDIATTKLPDLNANDLDAAMKIVEGTARSMGVTVSE